MTSEGSVGREVTVTLTAADLIGAHRLLLNSNLREPRRLVTVGILWLCLAALFVSLAGGGLVAGVVAVIAAAAVVLAVPLLSHWFVAPWTARHALREVAAFRGPLVYRWSNEGMACETLGGRSLTRWQTYRRHLRGEGMMLIWPHPGSYQILPGRAFSTAQLDEIANLIDGSRREPSLSGR